MAGEPRQGNPTNVPLPEGETATTLQQKQLQEQQQALAAYKPVGQSKLGSGGNKPLNQVGSGVGTDYKPPSGGSKYVTSCT